MTALSRKTKFLFLTFIIICMAMNFFTLKNGHNWGDDFSQYIMHAQNIIMGQSYSNRIMLDNPVVYPPGYPLLLVPLLMIFGLNFVVLKMWNIIFWFGTICLSFLILKDELEELSSWLFSCLLASSAFFFIFKQNVISDIPFVFFVTLTLLMVKRFVESQETKTNQNLSELGLFMCLGFCLWLRSAGVAIILTGVVYGLFIRKCWKMVWIGITSFVVFYILQRLWIGNKSGYFSSIIAFPREFIVSALTHASLMFKSLWYFIVSPMSFLSQPIYLVGETFIELTSIAIFGVLLWYLLKRLFRREIDVIELFFLLYGILLVFWSGFPNMPADFVRFVFPLIIPGAIILIRLSKLFCQICKIKFFNIFARGILGLLILLNIINIAAVFDYNDDVLFIEENATMLAWIRNNSDPNEHFMMWPARVGALLTGRVGTNFWLDANQPHADWQKRIDEYNIHFLVFHKYADQPLMNSIAGDVKHFVPVWENSSFRIFRYTKDKS